MTTELIAAAGVVRRRRTANAMAGSGSIAEQEQAERLALLLEQLHLRELDPRPLDDALSIAAREYAGAVVRYGHVRHVHVADECSWCGGCTRISCDTARLCHSHEGQNWGPVGRVLPGVPS